MADKQDTLHVDIFIPIIFRWFLFYQIFRRSSTRQMRFKPVSTYRFPFSPPAVHTSNTAYSRERSRTRVPASNRAGNRSSRNQNPSSPVRSALQRLRFPFKSRTVHAQRRCIRLPARPSSASAAEPRRHSPSAGARRRLPPAESPSCKCVRWAH